MKKKYKYLLTGGILLSTATPLAWAQTPINVIPGAEYLSFGHTYYIDYNDDNNLKNMDSSIKKGSRIYGYIYDPQNTHLMSHFKDEFYGYIKRNDEEMNFEYKVPTGTCMDKSGLPAFLPIKTVSFHNNAPKITFDKEENKSIFLAPEWRDNKTYVGANWIHFFTRKQQRY